MRNLRGVLFLGWLLASPPMLKSLMWQDLFSVTDLSAISWGKLPVMVYYGYWLVWFALGAFVIWLVADPERIDRPMRAFWGRLTGKRAGGPPPDPGRANRRDHRGNAAETAAEAAKANEEEEDQRQRRGYSAPAEPRVDVAARRAQFAAPTPIC